MSGQAGILEANASVTREQVLEKMAPYADQVAELRRRYPVPRGALLPLLHVVQEAFGWVPREGIRWASEHAEVSPVHAFGVVEFYTMYRQAPVGRYLVQVCHNVCCHIQGAEDLIGHLEQRLGIQAGETTEDGMFTLLRVECLAFCGNGPAILINDEFLYGPEELNKQEEGWHPTTADLDLWLDRLTAEAGGDSSRHEVDGNGDIVLNTAGHPGGAGADGEFLPAEYAPVAPVIQVAASGDGDKITVTGLAAPECSKAICEVSEDDGQSWAVVEELDVSSLRGVPGPPGGPKPLSIEAHLPIGSTATYRWLAWEGDAAAKPSATAVVTATEPEPAASEDSSEGGDS
jgi:NADH:ubiquinone oxidoreductase subunit E